MPQYLVVLPSETEGARRVNNRDAMVVSAPSAAAAKEVAKSWRDDDSNEKWDVATVTELVEGLEADFALRVRITKIGDTQPTEFLAPAGEASFAALAAAMEALLEADADIGANVTVAAGPPVVLTLAAGANQGDAEIEADLLLNGYPIAGHIASVAAPVPGVPASARAITFIDQSANDLAKLQAALTSEPL